MYVVNRALSLDPIFTCFVERELNWHNNHVGYGDILSTNFFFLLFLFRLPS